MKSATRVIGDIKYMTIGYNYISHKVLGFIAMEGGGSTEPGVPYLSSYPDNYSNVSICTVIFPNMIVRYFSACNAIENHNRIHNCELAIAKYWVDAL